MSSEDRGALVKLLRRVSRELVEGRVLTQQWRKAVSVELMEAVVELDRESAKRG